VRKILVVHRGYLGDTLVFLPTLKALRARFPGARIVVGVQPEMRAAPLLHASGDVDEVRTLGFVSGGRWRRLGEMLRLFAEGYDLLVAGVWYSLAPEALFCGAPRCVGLYDGHPLQELLDGLLPLNPNLHEADNDLALVEALGAAPSRADRVPRLGTDPAVAADAGAALLRQLGVPDTAGIVVLHPGSKRATRRWPADRFAQLAQRLLEDDADLRVVMTGVAGEVPLIEAVRAAVAAGLRGRAISAAGRTTLEALVGLLDRAAVAVCNDTGVMHLARARDVPLVALLGPENDRRWGPYPLGRSPAVALRVEVPCAPCARWSCESHVCMKATTVDDVYWEVRRLLNRPRRLALLIAPSTSTEPSMSPAQGDNQPADELISIERRITRRSWRELAAGGADLPPVSVVVLPEERADDEQVAAMVAAAAAQDYSRTDLLLVVPLGATFKERVSAALEAASGTGLRCHAVHADARDVERSLSTAVATARGEFIAVVTSIAAWPVARVGLDVATLVRGPRGTGARGTSLLDLQCVSKFGDIVDATWHRAALMDWLWARGALPATLTEPPVVPDAGARRWGSGLVNRVTMRNFLHAVPGGARNLLRSALRRRAAGAGARNAQPQTVRLSQ
jgi:ADP-heptose:LPS heptosyltransferase